MANTKALVMQSGGSTPVLNRSLFGIAKAVEESNEISGLMGSLHGVEGLYAGNLVNLDIQNRSWWQRTARTPGAILGSTRKRLQDDRVSEIIKILLDHSIGYLFIIGGNDSAETGHKIAAEALSSNIDIRIVNVPKTIDNDLAVTDHSPGYGSAARFVSLATMGIGRDAETMGNASPITIMEVMGRNSGWLAAASAISKYENMDAPHVICVPEIPIDETRFLDILADAYDRYGFAVAVVAENTRGPNGVIGGQEIPYYTDEFGHAYFDGPARYLGIAVSKHLKLRVRYEKPGTIQRSMVTCLSSTDSIEAEEAGRSAIQLAIKGYSDVMVTLLRNADGPYTCTTGISPLKDIAGVEKKIPEAYYDTSDYMVTSKFIDYATPLVGKPLPRFNRL